MRVEENEPCPLPQDPILAEVAQALRDSGDWGWVVDRDWRIVYITDEQRTSFMAGTAMSSMILDEHLFGPEAVRIGEEWRTGPTRPELWRNLFAGLGGLAVDAHNL